MKSRISFFDRGLFKKDILRFAPLWALYTIGLLLTFFSVRRDPGYLANYLGNSISDFGIVNICYAIVTAQLLFGDLFSARLCNALHAMPMRRETRFFTHVIAGFSFSFVPNLLVALICLLFLGEFWFLSPMWLLGVTLSYVTFFGIAVFSTFCAGSRFAMAAVYAILNFVSWVAYWFADTVYLPMMQGVTLSEDSFAFLSPVYTIAGSDFANFTSHRDNWLNTRVYEFRNWGDGWLYLAIAAVIGIALMACALVLYRRRALESAGDFMAVRWLKPVFLIVYTLCAGAFLAMFGSAMGSIYLIFLGIGVICGFFTGHMLLERNIRVFRKKRFLQLGILLVALGLSIVATKADLFGIVHWVPDADQVKAVHLEGAGEDLVLEDPRDIEAVLTAHEAFLDKDDSAPGQYANIWLTYNMKSGRTVKRNYAVLSSTPELLALEKKFFSTPEAVFQFKDSWESYKDSVIYINYYTNGSTFTIRDPQAVDSLLEALYADCLAGNMTQSWAFHNDAETMYAQELSICTTNQNVLYLTIYSDAQNTCSFLSGINSDTK